MMIYHIATQYDWEQAQMIGLYRTESLDSQGFIHCSGRDQALRVANAFFRGRSDLVILHIEPERLDAELRYDPPTHPPGTPPPTESEERFPHLYGALNLDAVAAVTTMIADPFGVYDERIFGEKKL